ncbi:MAG: hypothetical protein ACLQUY_08040, partial [Ktedonobacterales bacterium]
GLFLFGVSDPVLVSGQVTGLLCAAVGLAGISQAGKAVPSSGPEMTLPPMGEDRRRSPGSQRIMVEGEAGDV